MVLRHVVSVSVRSVFVLLKWGLGCNEAPPSKLSTHRSGGTHRSIVACRCLWQRQAGQALAKEIDRGVLKQ